MALHQSVQEIKEIQGKIWDYRMHFKDVDKNIDQGLSNNPIFNQNAIADYIDNSFTKSTKIKKRQNYVKKALLVR